MQAERNRPRGAGDNRQRSQKLRTTSSMALAMYLTFFEVTPAMETRPLFSMYTWCFSTICVHCSGLRPVKENMPAQDAAEGVDGRAEVMGGGGAGRAGGGRGARRSAR